MTVLSTDDPVRVFQQFATLDALSNGRAEITAGRGSSTESFPLFGHSLNDYDDLYAEKLALLLTLNDSESVTWEGRFRPALNDALVVPRPENGKLPIWLATGGNPNSTVRAAMAGLPVSYAIIGGQAERFAPLAQLYRQAVQQVQVPGADVRVSVASPGFIGEDAVAAKNLWWKHYHEGFRALGEIRGFPAPQRASFDYEANGGGALFVGSPAEIADRIVALHGAMKHDRHFFQMDMGQLPQKDFLRSIELLGTKVKPLVDAALAEKAASDKATA